MNAQFGSLHRSQCATAVLLSCLLVSARAFADSVAPPAKDDSVTAELASFEVADGFAVNLFASEKDGIANPITMRWDARGRLWVLCSSVYPQIVPTEKANDKLYILEDTDHDGRADKTSVFMDGLHMPTGFAIGNGGVYIGEGTDLIFCKDADGDGKAETREVIFTGFGTGDTHQNINSFTWSPGGELFFCQGLHSFARVETPWGIVRLDEHGVWRMRPRRRQLHSYRGGSSQNPWGVAFGRWGEPLVKGGSGTTISELVPIMIPTDHFQPPLDIGATQIKSMIAQIVESSHLPDDMQGDVIIAGYFAHLIDRMKIEPEGSGHRTTNVPPLIRSNHRSFRPVDIQIGPDGAIYIADWYNPIIGHYQASFRHPDRDKSHGRVWRVVAKGRPLLQPPALTEMTASELCEQLKSKESWVRTQAKRLLMEMPTKPAIEAVTKWVDSLDPTDANFEHHLYEAIGVFESHEVINRPLLERLLRARDYRARAYATRVVGRWHDRIENPLDVLATSVADESPRVRLEAVVACSYIGSPDAMAVAARATSQPTDRFIVAALSQCVHALADKWLPALQAGELRFDQPEHLVYVLRTHGGNDVAAQVRSLLRSDTVSVDGRRQLLELLARVGNAQDLRLVFDAAASDATLLRAIVPIVASRRVRPSGNVADDLTELLASRETQTAALRLAGLWKEQSLTSKVRYFVNRSDAPAQVRAAAILSILELSPSDVRLVRSFITRDETSIIQFAALSAVSRVDIAMATADGLKLLAFSTDSTDVAPILSILLQRRGAAGNLAKALSESLISSDQAKLISRWLSANGYDDQQLIDALKTAMGIQPADAIPYSEALVTELAADVRANGDADSGRKVFASALTNCTACHQVQGIATLADAFPKGPELTAVGAGLQLELIIESVIWPKRQIKEGYELTTLLLADGRVVSGYVVAENNGQVALRELTTGAIGQFASDEIEERVKKGTAMPTGFTNTLTKTELRDLVAFLSGLRGTKTN
ncbi:MAG: HEAT repeat domain-containing protein [Planctomycetes bacterium]|nr:HEAT repeat domain-containing protein [Planctomycetota bacterium]